MGVIVASQDWQNGSGGTEAGSLLKILSSSHSSTIKRGTNREYPHLVQMNSTKSSFFQKPSKIFIFSPPMSKKDYKLEEA